MKIRAAVLYEQGRPGPYADSTPLIVETVDLDATHTVESGTRTR